MDGDATSEEVIIIIMSGADLGVSFRRVREYTSSGDALDFNFLKFSFRGFLCYLKNLTERSVEKTVWNCTHLFTFLLYKKQLAVGFVCLGAAVVVEQNPNGTLNVLL